MTAPPPDAIAKLAKQLIASANDCDWAAVADYNQQVDRLLTSLRTTLKHMPEPLRAAVTELQSAHRQARALVVQENEKLAERMANLRNNREGLRAYEQSGGQV